MKRSTKYLLDSLTTTRRTKIVDVGANPLNSPPYEMLLRMGGCDVLGFEPNIEAFNELQRTKSEREAYLPYAVGDGSEVVFNFYKSSGLSSAFKPYEGAFSYLGRSRRNMSLIRSVVQNTTRLDDVDELASFDLLKIDVQGSEVAVFQGGETKLATAMAIIAEVRFYQLYENEPMLGGVDTELRKQGYQFLKFSSTKTRIVPNSQQYSINRPIIRSQMLDADAVYISDLAKLDLYSNEQLKHLAILACSVFESYDLTLFCLDELVKRGDLCDNVPGAFVATFPAKLRETPEQRKAARIAAQYQ